jgi:hypothetical protein
MIFTIIKRKNVQSVEKLIAFHNPKAFYSIEDIKNTKEGVFTPAPAQSMNAVRAIFPVRKVK